MISALCWVPRGAPAAVPERDDVERAAEGAADGSDSDADVAGDMEALEAGGDDDDLGSASDDEGAPGSDEDMETAAVAAAEAAAEAMAAGGNRRARRAAKQPAGREQSERGGRKKASKSDALLEGLNMDEYSDEEDPELTEKLFGEGTDIGGMYYASNAEDPFLQGGEEGGEEGGGEDSDDEYTLRDSDLLILATRQDEEMSSLVAYVYEEADVGDPEGGNLLVHHDVVLPSYPLCLAWMDCDPLQRADASYGNFVATGTFDPEIEIFNLDVLDQVEPERTLGGRLTKKARAKKKAAGTLGKGVKKGSHADAVMSLSWNAHFRNVLASGSADETVKLWDVVEGKCQTTLKHHSDKVQSVVWNPAEGAVLATGGFEGAACVLDVRVDDPARAALRWSLSSDVEAIAWDAADPTKFAASADDGSVGVYDARAGGGSAPLLTLPRTKKPQCCMAFNPGARGLLATGSTDTLVRLWDVSGGADGAAQPLAEKDVRCGGVFGVAFCVDSPHLLAAAGSKGEATVWDLRVEADAVTSRLAGGSAQ